jgi:uncharacterized protein (DUF111 family)
VADAAWRIDQVGNIDSVGLMAGSTLIGNVISVRFSKSEPATLGHLLDRIAANHGCFSMLPVPMPAVSI